MTPSALHCQRPGLFSKMILMSRAPGDRRVTHAQSICFLRCPWLGAFGSPCSSVCLGPYF